MTTRKGTNNYHTTRTQNSTKQTKYVVLKYSVIYHNTSTFIQVLTLTYIRIVVLYHSLSLLC